MSASGQVTPPFMVYPRKRPVPKKMRIGAYPDTVFRVSDSGWMTIFFMVQDVTQRVLPVLLVLDGHGSHIPIDVIEFA